MARFVLSPRAQQDIEDIWDFSAERWGVDRAEQYVRDIREAIESIAGDVRRAVSCDDIRAGYYRHSVGRHVLFFKPRTDGIDVIRILHQSMDFRRHL